MFSSTIGHGPASLATPSTMSATPACLPINRIIGEFMVCNMNGQGGSRAFLEGVNNQTYSYNNARAIHDSYQQSSYRLLSTQAAMNSCNYYGIYPSTYQTSTRALSNSTHWQAIIYSWTLTFSIPSFSSDYFAGAIYNHCATGSTNITGSLLALGLTRTPDVRVTA